MKTIIALLLFACSIAVAQNPIRVSAGTDTVVINGQTIFAKLKAQLTTQGYNAAGELQLIGFVIKYYDASGNNALNVVGSDHKKLLYKDYEETFSTAGKWINTSTKKILKDTTGVVNKARLTDYLRVKAMNSFPGVSNSSPVSLFIEGVLKEIIAIKQASKELPL